MGQNVGASAKAGRNRPRGSRRRLHAASFRTVIAGAGRVRAAQQPAACSAISPCDRLRSAHCDQIILDEEALMVAPRNTLCHPGPDQTRKGRRSPRSVSNAEQCTPSSAHQQARQYPRRFGTCAANPDTARTETWSKRQALRKLSISRAVAGGKGAGSFASISSPTSTKHAYQGARLVPVSAVNKALGAWRRGHGFRRHGHLLLCAGLHGV